MVYIKYFAELILDDKIELTEFDTENDTETSELVDLRQHPKPIAFSEIEYDIETIKFNRSEKYKKSEYFKKYYQVVSSISTFFLLDQIANNSFDTLFSWISKKRGKDIFILIESSSISRRRINTDICAIEKWIDSNGKLVNIEDFSMPPNLDDESKGGRKVVFNFNELYEIAKIDRKNERYISWDINSPEINAGDGEFLILCVSTAIPIIQLIINLYGFATPEQREYRRSRQEIEQAIDIIYNKYSDEIKGVIDLPKIDEYCLSNRKRKVYIFREYVNDICVNTYYATVIKHQWRQIRIIVNK
jgi:hypothetical protein